LVFILQLTILLLFWIQWLRIIFSLEATWVGTSLPFVRQIWNRSICWKCILIGTPDNGQSPETGWSYMVQGLNKQYDILLLYTYCVPYIIQCSINIYRICNKHQMWYFKCVLIFHSCTLTGLLSTEIRFFIVSSHKQ